MATGLDGRHRDKDGEIEAKRGDTLVKTLRKTYGDNFLRDWRGDARLDTVRAETGKDLSQLIKDKHNYGR
jgi:hypothetical protein